MALLCEASQSQPKKSERAKYFLQSEHMATEPLKPLMEKAHKGGLGLPEFQRDFVWKTSQVVKLVTSLLNGYPIGGLLFMEDEKVYGFRALDGAPVTTAEERLLVLVTVP